MELMDKQKLSNFQLVTIFLCVLMNMMDGIDVMVISYAAPAIAKEWSVSAQSLGNVLSAGLVGMMLGALFLAPRADVIGRRIVIIISGLLMGISVFCTSFAPTVEVLLFLRLLSGIGIGSMIASVGTLVSEYAPQKTKAFWVSFIMAGYPIGATLSGFVAASIIPTHGWRFMFQMAGIATLIPIPIIFIYLAESVSFLLKMRPANALEKVNVVLQRMNAPKLSALPEQSFSDSDKKKVPISDLFAPQFSKATIFLWIALFLAFGTMYFLTTWIPKLATNAGLSMSLAIYAGTVFNMGAFFGIITQGYLSNTFGLRRTVFGILVMTALLMIIFGNFTGSAWILVLFGLIGFGIQGGYVGIYTIAATLYPTEIRSTGVGWATGMGRIGSIAGPILGGFLITIGLTMASTFIVFAVPTVIAGVVVLLIKNK